MNSQRSDLLALAAGGFAACIFRIQRAGKYTLAHFELN
jgi:hypothetical protein